jgi:non-heme chloroperoxidase
LTEERVSYIETHDGTDIYFKELGEGPVVTFSHGWPLNADMWEGQLQFLADHGFRAVAHDRRGHGRSGRSSIHNDVDGYADDLAALIEALDLTDVTLVAHSNGGGEVTRYIGRHGTARVSKVVLVAAIPPLLLQTDSNPEGLPRELFDGFLTGMFADRSQFYRSHAIPFYGANLNGTHLSQSLLDQFWTWSMQSGLKNSYDCVRAIAETDFTEDLAKLDVPILLIHREDNHVVDIQPASVESAQLIGNVADIFYPGAPHGFVTTTHPDQVNGHLLEFLES